MGAISFTMGKFGYRKENAIADEKAKFDGEFLKSFDDARNAGRLDEWIAQGQGRGECPPEKTASRPSGLPTRRSTAGRKQPKKHGEDEIHQQFEWGGAMLLLAALVIGHVLLTRGKTLTGRTDSHGHARRRGGAFCRCFQNRQKEMGPARDWPMSTTARTGLRKRAVVDDLKYDGAGRVLDRLLGQFNGELDRESSGARAALQSTTGGTPDAS